MYLSDVAKEVLEERKVRTRMHVRTHCRLGEGLALKACTGVSQQRCEPRFGARESIGCRRRRGRVPPV
jgi:hypothetical protein